MFSGFVETPSFSLFNVILEDKRLNVKAGGLKLPFYSEETQADVVVVVVVGVAAKTKRERKGRVVAELVIRATLGAAPPLNRGVACSVAASDPTHRRCQTMLLNDCYPQKMGF